MCYGIGSFCFGLTRPVFNSKIHIKCNHILFTVPHIEKATTLWNDTIVPQCNAQWKLRLFYFLLLSIVKRRADLKGCICTYIHHKLPKSTI